MPAETFCPRSRALARPGFAGQPIAADLHDVMELVRQRPVSDGQRPSDQRIAVQRDAIAAGAAGNLADLHARRRVLGIAADDRQRHLARPKVGVGAVRPGQPFEIAPQQRLARIGEIGVTAEIEAAGYIKEHITKSCAAFIAGQTAPPGKRMGHAGAIISGGQGTAAEKIEALRAAGVEVALSPGEMGAAMKRAIDARK